MFTLSTRAKATGRMLLFPSCAMAMRRVPAYFPYRCVPSTETSGLQCLNA
ncbi:uncharacterized protein DS421_20g706770 [Arachis hypogaea]|nr:uncharacterized protein DS421_20g706770 [Arachis hypogaea]